MPIEVTMPRLSDTMERGTVVKWNVKPGDKVSQGQVLADIETDKATMELQSFDNGTVAKLAAAEGTQVGVGALILVIAKEGEDWKQVAGSAAGRAPAGSEAPASAAKSTANKPAAEHKAGAASAPPARSSSTAVMDRPAAGTNGAHSAGHEGDRIFASPLARKIAAEEGLSLAGIHGSGPSGRIIRRDVEAALATGAAPAAAPRSSTPAIALPAPGAALEARSIALSNMRAIIAKRLVESKTTIPHYQVTVEADMDALMALRSQLNEQLASQGVKLSVNDFLVRACALAMHEHPFINSRWAQKGNDAAIDLIDRVNIGIAISLPMERGGGLVVGTVRDADRVGLRAISAESKRLADKARNKGLSPEEMSDSTFTISNLGMFGVSHFTAIINPPNVAILAVGAAIERPVVKNGQVVPGHVMSMTMSSDHRVVDGAMAAAYLASVKNLLEKPATLLV